MNKFNKSLQRALSLSSIIIGSIFFFGLLGFYLNQKFDNKVWFVASLIFGAIFGLYELYKQINK